jgi:hypothetical protein
MQSTQYIPFQELMKSKIHKIVNYGKPYSNYTCFPLIENADSVMCIYVDKEPNKVDKLDDTQNQYYVEIYFTPSANKPPQKIIMTNREIDTFIEKYGCKL